MLLRQEEKGIRRDTVLAVFVLLVLTILLTYPAVFQLSTHLIASQGDAWQFPWNIFHFRERVLHGEDPYYTDFIFHPAGTRLLLHNYTEFHGVLGIPLSLFFNDIALNNLFVLLATFLSGLGAYLLCREVTGSVSGSLFAAVAFAFCPVRMFWISSQTHMSLTEWIPFALWAFLKTCDTRKTSFALLTALFFALAAYCNYYFAVYLLIAFVVVLLFGLWKFPGWRSRDVFAKLALAGLAAVVLLLPVVFEFLQAYRERTVYSYAIAEDFAVQKSANLIQYVRLGSMNPLLRKWLGENPLIFPSSKLTPGWTLLALGSFGLVLAFVRRTYKLLLFFLVASVFFLLSLGPFVEIGSYSVPMPFDVIARIPYLNHLRFAWRFAVMVSLCLAILSGYALSVMAGRLSKRTSTAVLASCFIILLAELSPVPLEMEPFDPPPVFTRLGASGSQVMLSVPYYPSVGWVSHYMCYQMIHKQKMLDGRISRPPQPQVDYFRKIPIGASLRGISSFGKQATEGMIEADRRTAPFFTGFFRIRHLMLFPPFSSRPDVLGYVAGVFPQARLMAEQKDIKVYELPENDIRMYRLVAGDPVLHLFLLSSWKLEGSAEERRVVSGGKEARLLLPEMPGAGKYTLVLRMRSEAAQKARVTAGKFQQDVDLNPELDFYAFEIPAESLRLAHQVVKMQILDETAAETRASFELRALKLTIQ